MDGVPVQHQDGPALSVELDEVAAPSGRWRPTPVIAGSIGLHCVAGMSAILVLETWDWALGAVIANHLFIGGVGLWPRSRLLGPNYTRLPMAAAARGEIALTFDDGPDPDVTPRVLDILDAYGARATFFCIADKAKRHPEVVREIARRGHAVENHSCNHQHTFPMLGLGGIRKELAAAQAALTDLTGRPPRFFRAPAGLRNPLLDPVLHDMGLKLVSWTRRGFDTREGDAAVVASRLESGLAAGDILLLHDGHSARTASGAPVVLEVLPRILDTARSRGLKPVPLTQAIDP
jgi:peptidoglycan/xylan/chitin deacetylase (PgdA/CDA1 family)